LTFTKRLPVSNDQSMDLSEALSTGHDTIYSRVKSWPNY